MQKSTIIFYSVLTSAICFLLALFLNNKLIQRVGGNSYIDGYEIGKQRTAQETERALLEDLTKRYEEKKTLTFNDLTGQKVTFVPGNMCSTTP